MSPISGWVRNGAILATLALSLCALPAGAQSFRVQCPATTTLHPGACRGPRNAGQACVTPADCPNPRGTCVGGGIDPGHPGQIKCQHVGGGDGYATMGDGTQIYLFAFSPLSGLADIQAGKPGTQTAAVFNTGYVGPNYATTGEGACVGGTNTGEPCRAVSECPDQTSAGARCALPVGRNLAPTPNNGAIVEPAGISWTSVSWPAIRRRR